MSLGLISVLFVGAGGGFGGDRGGGGGDMITQEDTVFVQGMNPSTTEDELCKYFGAIGIIKVIKIKCYHSSHNSTC